MKQCLDKGSTYQALLTDPSKSFDCLPHNTLIVKLGDYGIEENFLKL